MTQVAVHRIAALSVLCATAMSPVAAWSQTDSASGTVSEVAELRQIILDYAAQFTSFKGVYQLTQDLEDGRLWEAEFECRVQGDDIYLDMREGPVSRNPEGDPGQREIYTTWDGVISARFDKYEHPQVLLRASSWMAPPMAYLDPRVLFLEIHGKTASEWLAAGTDTVIHREGMRVLSHLMEGCACSYDVHIDDQGLIRKLEYSMRLLEPDDEVREYWKEDLFDVRRVEVSWEFDAHQLVDGVMCPCLVTSTWYAHDDSISEALWAARDAGAMTNLEAWVRNYTENPATTSAVQTMELTEVAGVVFNEPLEKKDFELEIPIGATVMDATTEFSYVVKPKRWWQRIPSDAWLAAGLVSVLAVITFSGYGLWRRYA